MARTTAATLELNRLNFFTSFSCQRRRAGSLGPGHRAAHAGTVPFRHYRLARRVRGAERRYALVHGPHGPYRNLQGGMDATAQGVSLLASCAGAPARAHTQLATSLRVLTEYCQPTPRRPPENFAPDARTVRVAGAVGAHEKFSTTAVPAFEKCLRKSVPHWLLSGYPQVTAGGTGESHSHPSHTRRLPGPVHVYHRVPHFRVCRCKAGGLYSAVMPRWALSMYHLHTCRKPMLRGRPQVFCACVGHASVRMRRGGMWGEHLHRYFLQPNGKIAREKRI